MKLKAKSCHAIAIWAMQNPDEFTAEIAHVISGAEIVMTSATQRELFILTLEKCAAWTRLRDSEAADELLVEIERLRMPRESVPGEGQ